MDHDEVTTLRRRLAQDAPQIPVGLGRRADDEAPPPDLPVGRRAITRLTAWGPPYRL